MKWILALTAALLCVGCAATVSSVDAVCGITPPSFTLEELEALSERTLSELDLFFERRRVACGL